jgi:hypothetical protein
LALTEVSESELSDMGLLGISGVFDVWESEGGKGRR